MERKLDKVILFGGSFDPSHRGHMEMIEKALKSSKADALFLIPALKAASASGKKSPSASFEDRLRILELSLEESGTLNTAKEQNISLEILEIEKTLPVPNYTFNTVKELKKKYPESAFTFLMGQDQVKEFHLWHKAKELLQMMDILCIKRQNEKESAEKDIENVLEKLGISYERKEGEFFLKELGSKITYLNEDISAAKSTIIRDQENDHGWLFDAARTYIKENGLYGEKQ